MAQQSNIDWTDASWNPITGCTPVSEGCVNCYAALMAKRLHKRGDPHYRNRFAVTVHPDRFDLPLRWTKPRMIFVNSMSDLFHPKVPTDDILAIVDVMARARHHLFQVLTKRPERLIELSRFVQWPDNVWLGVSVENQSYVWRVELLRQVPVEVRFVSFEPLLGPIPNPDLSGIGWVIVGGESGPNARPMAPEWARHIRDICLRERIPFFFKQWGGRHCKAGGHLLDGQAWRQFPPQYDRWRATVANTWQRRHILGPSQEHPSGLVAPSSP